MINSADTAWMLTATALVLLMITGVAIFALTSLISWLLLHRWHESALKREN